MLLCVIVVTLCVYAFIAGVFYEVIKEHTDIHWALDGLKWFCAFWPITGPIWLFFRWGKRLVNKIVG